MLKKLILSSTALLALVLLLSLAPACGNGAEEPEATPAPPRSGAGQDFLIEVTKPDDARQSEWALISVDATCKLDSFTTIDKVDSGTIGICFPYLAEVEDIRVSFCSMDRYEIYAPGERITSEYGTGSEITVPYPIVEARQTTWARDARESVTLQVRPEHAGNFTFFVKAYGSFLAGSFAVTVHEPIDGTRDEQNEYVQVHSFEVAK